MGFIRLLLAVLATFAGLNAVPALAQATAYAPGQGALNRIEVGIEVRASVRDRCGFAADGAPGGSVSQADFDRQGISREFAIRLNCTGASRVAVSSQNGALAHAEQAAGYASAAPYDVELRLVGDNGTVASGTCAAAGLQAEGACLFGGSATGSNGLRLSAASTRANGSYLRVSAAPYAGSAPLMAGSYSDTLTITVSAAP